MSIITPTELGLLRQRPHRTKLYLSIFRPSTVLACQVNDGSIDRNARSITFDGVTSGSYLNVYAGMSLLVGSAPGLDDYGRVRIRSITSSVITVAENSYIDWQDNLYLTVLRYWEVWPIYPRIISDPSNPENTLWYKDYDIAYSDQNTVLGAIPCAGPHRAAFLENGNASLYYTASGTAQVAGSSYSTHWFFEGATTTGSAAFTPGYVSYNTPGHYVTCLTITGSNFVDTTYRYVSIYDKPGEGDNVPILQWELKSLETSKAEGGYTASIRVLENIDIREGDVVVIFGESWYGSTKQTIGGNAENSSDIFFVGHILKNTIMYDYKLGEVNFTAGSITEFMKEQEGFSVSVESVSSPAYWYQLYDLNFKKALYHYLKWHSTVMSISDVQALVDDRPLQYFDSDRTSLYDAIDNLFRNAILGGVASDIQGKIWAQHGAHAFPSLSAQTYSTPIMVLKKQDWIGSPRIDESLIPKTSYVEYGGIAYSGVVTGTFTPLMGDAPGNAPLYRGNTKRSQGLALKSQTELNSITGNVLANDNAKYSRIEYSMIGAYRNFDIAPQEIVTLMVEAGDTPRGVAISGSYMLDSASWVYDAEQQLFYPQSIGFVPLVTGTAGQTITIPQIPDDGGFGVPSLKIPNIPAISFPSYLSGLTGAGPYIRCAISDLGSLSVLDNSGFPTPSSPPLIDLPSGAGAYILIYRCKFTQNSVGALTTTSPAELVFNFNYPNSIYTTFIMAVPDGLTPTTKQYDVFAVKSFVTSAGGTVSASWSSVFGTFNNDHSYETIEIIKVA